MQNSINLRKKLNCLLEVGKVFIVCTFCRNKICIAKVVLGKPEKGEEGRQKEELNFNFFPEQASAHKCGKYAFWWEIPLASLKVVSFLFLQRSF